MPRYASTDPNFGQPAGASKYASTDPDFGAAPVAEQSSALRRFLSPLLPSTTLSDYWEGPKYALQHPIDSAKLVGGAIANDPVGAMPVVGRVKHGIEDIQQGDYAGAAGNGAGLLLDLFGLRKAAPEIVPDVVAPMAKATARGTGAVVDAVGRGAERVGSSPMMRHASTIGATGEILKGNVPSAVAMAVGPSTLRGAGRVAQRLGARLKDLGAPGEVEAPVTAGAHADQMASGAAKYAAGKTAQTAQRDAAATASGVSLDDLAEPKPTATPGPMSPRLVGKAPSLNDTLQQALESVKGGPSPATRTSDKLPDTPDARFQEPPASPPVHRFGPPKEATADARLRELFGDETSPREAERFGQLFNDEVPARTAIPAAEPMAGDPGAEFHSMGLPTEPQATLEKAVSGITGDGDGMAMPYSDWASQIDDIVNQTTPHDLAQHPAQAGLRTAAWKKFINSTPLPAANRR